MNVVYHTCTCSTHTCMYVCVCMHDIYIMYRYMLYMYTQVTSCTACFKFTSDDGFPWIVFFGGKIPLKKI